MEVKKLLAQVAEQHQNHTKALTVFKECYEGLQIGPYSDEVLQDVIENGTNNVSEKFKSIASEQLDKSGISSPLLKANLLKGCDEVLHQFEVAISGIYDSAVAYNKKQEFDRITKTQMKISFMGIVGNSIAFSNHNRKALQLGIGLGFVTECKKSYDFEACSIEVRPSNDTYYVYAAISRETNKAKLTVFTEPQPNNDEYLMVLWQSGTFDQIKI